MSIKHLAGLVGAVLLAAAMSMALPQEAKAESGFLWFDSAYAWPTARANPAPRWKRVYRHKAVAHSAVRYALPPAAPSIVRVAVATPRDCFWCNVRISGLSF